MLRLIRRNTHFKSKDIILRLYKTLVRPKLEYCIQVWSPFLKKDIDALERIQKRATKMIFGLNRLRYENRLKECQLLPLTKRRVRGDLIETFKLLKGLDKIHYSQFFNLSETTRTRGHTLKLNKYRSNKDIRKNFFSQRVVDSWNKLPQNVVDAETVNTFKNRLGKFNTYD